MRCFCVSHVTQGFSSKLQMASRLQLEKESEEDEFIITLLLLHCLETRKPKKSHQYWLNPLIRKRKKHGVFYHLFKELQLHDAPFQQYFRFTSQQFEDLLAALGDDIVKRNRVT